MSLKRKLLSSFALFVSVVAGAFSVTAAGAFGCSGSKSPDAASPAAASAAPASSAPAAESSSASSASSAAGGGSTAGGGEKAEETPKNCNFRVKGFCLATEEEACNAAGCDPGKCMVLEGKPGKVKCK